MGLTLVRLLLKHTINRDAIMDQTNLHLKPELSAAPGALRRLASVVFGLPNDDREVPVEFTEALLRNQLSAQLEAIVREIPIRGTVLAILAGLYLLFLPLWSIALIVFGVLVCDLTERRMIRRILSGATLAAQGYATMTVFAGEWLFSLPSSLIWQLDTMFSKAVSIGVMAASMMRLATVRSIHPDFGISGVLANASLIALFNTYYWLNRGEITGLVTTTIIAAVTCGYVIAAIVQNHRQRRQLAVSTFELERVSEAKSRFLRQVSHELRTPLNAIIGLGSSVHDRLTEPELRRHQGVLLSSAKSLGTLLDDLLDVSASETGRIALDPQPGEPRKEINQTADLFRPQAELTGVRLVLEVAPTVPTWLSLDWVRLRQCISNLLSNSLRHVLDGSIVIRADYDGTGALFVRVEDSGPGVVPEQRMQLFEWKKESDADSAGHGLGLAVCRALTRRMGGDIWYEERNSGAAFGFSVMAPPCPPTEQHKEFPPKKQALGGLSILIVDDVATNRLVASVYVKGLGSEAKDATSGREAVALLRTDTEIDLVLLDMNMPELDGLATLKLIRSLPGSSASIPVIAMTADASELDRERYLLAGLDGYVAKPLTIEMLSREIERVMALGNARRK